MSSSEYMVLSHQRASTYVLLSIAVNCSNTRYPWPRVSYHLNIDMHLLHLTNKLLLFVSIKNMFICLTIIVQLIQHYLCSWSSTKYKIIYETVHETTIKKIAEFIKGYVLYFTGSKQSDHLPPDRRER